MPFIGRGGSSPPPDTTGRENFRGSREFSRRVRPLKTPPAPLPGLIGGTSSGAGILPLAPAAAGILDSLPALVSALFDPPAGGALLWVDRDGMRVLWAGGVP